MAKITIKIDTANDAFRGDATGEVSRILEEYSSKILAYDDLEECNEDVLSDVNGNSCGSVAVKRR